MTTPDRGYILHRALPSVLGLVANLRKAHLRGYALPLVPPRDNGTAVIVGAGASLATSGDLLREMQADGALVFTTNTALPKLSEFLVPDVCVAREAIDVSAQLRYPVRCPIVDLAAHPSVWDAAGLVYSGEVGRVSDPRWFVAGGLQWFDLAAKLGVRPLFGGTASLTACVELARQWGATRIVLVGVTLAFERGGASYAPGTAYGDLRAKEDGLDTVTLSGPGLDAQLAVNGGRYPARQSARWVSDQHGGRLRQLLPWHDQMVWLENFAARHPAIECIDASGGALKTGWHIDANPRGTPMEMPEASAAPDTAAALADIARQCESTDAVASAVLSHGVIPDLPGYLDGADIVEAASAASLLLMRESHNGDHARAIRGTCEALKSGAANVRAALEAP